MRILISGAGIAGPTLAYWLDRCGFEPVIVESAPRLRTGGYIIDFWGAGYDIASRMGLLPRITSEGYKVRDVRVVDRNGKRVSGFSAGVFSRLTRDRYVSLPRGALAATIYDALEGRVETIFGDSVAGIEQTGSGVRVTFEHAGGRDFDLVVGADGLHSRVRELVFGPQERFETYLGYKAAAFEVEGYRPRDELVYVMRTEVGRQVVRFSLRGERTMFFITFADQDPALPDNPWARKEVLRRRFGGDGWEWPEILAALDRVDDVYLDRVSQIRMEPGLWSQGRTTLLGDAAFCASLLAGQGSSLAMTAAYILAGELRRAGCDHGQAFARYQNLFGPFVARKQKAALRFAGMFAPGSRLSIFFRDQAFKLMNIGPVADLLVGRDLRDDIELPNYG